MGNDAIQMRPTDLIRKPLAIWPSHGREGKVYEFGIAHTDGTHLTIDEYQVIRAALGMTTLPRDEILGLFVRFPAALTEDQELR